MHAIQLVLADLDGTVVLPEAQSASPAVIAAVRTASQRGIQFAAVTGRPYWMAKELLQAIGFTGPCVFEGGGVIIDPTTGKTLWAKALPAETARQAVARLAPSAFVIEYGAGVMAGNQADISAITKPTFSVWAAVPAQEAATLVDALATLPGVAVHANPGPGGDFSRTGVQVTHHEADKEHAVRALLALTGTDKAHTLAIGDGDNDLPLFKAATLKIAMGNATGALKAAADATVPPVHEDGFAIALRRYILEA